MRTGEEAVIRIDIPSLSGAMRAGTRCDVLSVFANRYGRETAHVRLEDGRVSLLAVEDLTQTDEVTNDDCDEPTIDAPDGGCADGISRADDAVAPGGGNGDHAEPGAEPARQPGVLADGSGPVSPADSVGHREPEARASIRAEARGIPAVVGETLGRCGFRLAARQFAEGRFYASREALKASWDVATERLSIWGTDRVLTLAEVEAEFGEREVPSEAEGRERLAACGWQVQEAPFGTGPNRFDCRKDSHAATWVPDLDKFWIRGTDLVLKLQEVERTVLTHN